MLCDTRQFLNLILIASLPLIIPAHPFNYFCDLPCGNVTNLMCERAPCGLARGCGHHASAGKFDDRDSQNAAVIHNEHRINIASGRDNRAGNGAATNMNLISYSRELAFAAQCWANSCKTHRKCVKTTNFDDDIGVNIYFKKFPGNVTQEDFKFKSVIEYWYGQIDVCDPRQIDKFGSEFCLEGKEFTQMIWADTRYVGCGVAFFKKKHLVVCLYAPRGNLFGQSVYKRGTPCSSCDVNDECYHGALCGRRRSHIEFKVPFHMMEKSRGVFARVSFSLIVWIACCIFF